MRRARHSARFRLVVSPVIIALCATVALALPPRAEAAIHLGSLNTVSLTNGLVGYWPLDGQVTDWATGRTKDISGNGNDGSLASVSTSSSAVAGKIGQGFRFQSQQYVSMSHVNELSGATKFTLSAWMKRPTQSDNVTLGQGTEATGWVSIEWWQDDKVYFEVGPPGAGSGTGSASLADTKWHHVTLVYDGTQSGDVNKLKGYIDGSQQSLTIDGPVAASSASNGNVFEIGRYLDGSQAWQYTTDGTIDDVRIYNRALSATEVQQLYNLGTAKIGHSNIAISNGLVGYWTFDGRDVNWATGKAADISGNSNDGSLALMSTSTSPTPGRIGQALNFLGTYTSYVSMGNVLHQSGAFTYSAWIYQTSQQTLDSAPTIMSRYISGSNNQETWWGLGNNGTPLELEVFSADGTSWVGRNYTGTLSPNTWYHVAATYDGGTTEASVKIFLNGVRVDNNTAGDGTFVSPRSTTLPFSIGATGDGYYPFAGKIDDARVYNRALSAAEIKQLYNLGSNTIGHSNTIISNGLVGYWTFDGPSIDWHTNTVADMSGQGNTGTLVSLGTSTSPTPGKIGQALNVNGSSSYVQTPGIITGSMNITECAWFNAKSFGGAIFAGIAD